MQERRALEADIDEGSLHARQHARDLTLVNVADQTTPDGPFDVDLLKNAVFEQRRSHLARGDVDQYLFFRRFFFG